MKGLLFLLLLLLSSGKVFCQIERITVPPGIVYNYCDSTTFELAKQNIRVDLSNANSYSLCGEIMFIGPNLWSRFKVIPALAAIKDGNTTLMVDDRAIPAKLIQRLTDAKNVWSEFRSEVGKGEYKLRKALPDELSYYWSVISFDIDEPLVILETHSRRYILNISKSTMQILWLDEAP